MMGGDWEADRLRTRRDHRYPSRFGQSWVGARGASEVSADTVVSYSGGRYVRGAKRQAEGSSLKERRYIVLVVASP